MEIDYKWLEKMGWIEAISNMFSLILKNFLRSVYLVFIIIIIEKKFTVGVTNGFYFHISNELKKKR